VIWVVMAVLLVLIGGIAIAVTKKKGGTTGQGGRAVVVPTADTARTVVVPPCATGVAVTDANARQQESTTGATRVQVPQGTGPRVVVVPRCPPKVGGSLPSAAFVLGPGSKIPAKGDKAARNPIVQDLRSEVIVPDGSPVKTVVVSPCSSQAKQGSSVVVGRGGADIAVAPPC
jgi:hypothetical protein